MSGTIKATYILVQAEVRYWEDATVNGIEDIDGTLIPMRVGSRWRPIIALSDGQVMGWPEGKTADIHYKVCDQGEYWLLGDDMDQPVAKWKGYYVPNSFLCHGNGVHGYGDYIIFNVGPDGFIEGWESPEINSEEWELLIQPEDEGNQEPTVTIPKSVFDDLMHDQKILAALHRNGVENWEWYEDAIDGVEE